MKQKNYFIYKYVDKNNNIVYIGQTTNLPYRIVKHRGDQLKNFNGDIYYYRCKHKTEMDGYEYFLIRKYHPKFNSSFVKEDDIFISEPKWILYKKEDFDVPEVGKPCKRKASHPGKAVQCIETLEIFESTRAVERIKGIPHSNISLAAQGKRMTAGGFHWRFVE